MLAECVDKFLDKIEGTMRDVGDRFEVTEERFNEINSTRYGTLVKAVEMPTEAVEMPSETVEEVEPDNYSDTDETEPQKRTRGRRGYRD